MNLILPRTLNKGESITLNIRYEDTWPYLNWADCGTASRSAGQSSGLQDYIPQFTVAPPGYPTRFRTRVGVPKDSPLVVSLSGQTTRQGTDGTWTGWKRLKPATAMYYGSDWCGGRCMTRPTRIYRPFGLFVKPRAECAQKLRTRSASCRTLLSTLAPELAIDELEVFEAPMQCNGYTWIAPHGMVSVQKTLVAGSARVGERGAAQFLKHRPHLESGLFAHELAHQYWDTARRPTRRTSGSPRPSQSPTHACTWRGSSLRIARCVKNRIDGCGSENTATRRTSVHRSRMPTVHCISQRLCISTAHM